MALVVAHVKRHMYALHSVPDSFTCSAAVKSTPVISKSRVFRSLTFGRGGGSGVLYAVPHIFLHVTHLLTVFFTICRPDGIQYRCRSAIKAVYARESNWRMCASMIMSFVRPFLGGNKMGNFV